MKSTTQFVAGVVAVTAVFFIAMIVQSTGLPRVRLAKAVAPARSVPVGVAAAARPPAGEKAAVPTVTAAPAPIDLAEENRRLRTENHELKDRLVAVLNWILANFKGKYPLPDNFLGKVQLAAVTDDYTLHPEAAEFIKATPEEKRKIDDALAYARQYLSDIEAAYMTVTNPRPDKVVLQIPAFPQEGKILQDDLYAALEITLGRDRFDRFLQVSESGLKSSFYQFGEASRTMVFELAYVGDDPNPQLRIKDGWVIEIGPNSRSVTAVDSVVSNLPPKYKAYMQWLPDYVAAYGGGQGSGQNVAN